MKTLTLFCRKDLFEMDYTLSASRKCTEKCSATSCLNWQVGLRAAVPSRTIIQHLNLKSYAAVKAKCHTRQLVYKGKPKIITERGVQTKGIRFKDELVGVVIFFFKVFSFYNFHTLPCFCILDLSKQLLLRFVIPRFVTLRQKKMTWIYKLKLCSQQVGSF